MKTPKATDVKKGIAALWESLQCPICLDLLTAPVSTKCDHQFCKFCIMKLLDNSKQNRADCPVCKTKITKRSLQESSGFQRLVAGLQDMIQAYELDTGTNYFTGLSQQNRAFSDTDGETIEHPRETSGDTTGKDTDSVENINHENPPRPLSSTKAAQSGFARLMGLEDSDPLTTENGGLDSGLGDAPLSDKKTSGATDEPEPETTDITEQAASARRSSSKRTSSKLEKASNSGNSVQTQDEAEPKRLRKSLRNKQREDSEAEKIFEQKKKKSLDKVAEWLMKVPPEGDLELEKPREKDDESDSCSSTSTIDIKLRNTEVNSKREQRTKRLEEQVFGAVYKRRSNRDASPPLKAFVEPSTSSQTQTHQGVSKVRKDQTPEDRRKKEVKDISSDIFEEAEQMEVGLECDTATNDEESHHLSESEKSKGDQEVPASVSDTEQQQPDTKTKKGTRSKLQDVDTDLHEQARAKSEGGDLKKADRRKAKNTRSEKKLAKVSNPLVLVGVNNKETSPKAEERSEQIHVQIECYPSSGEKEIPIVRKARRSRRLEFFAKEVQKGPKRVSLNANVPIKDCGVEKQSKADEGEKLDSKAPLKTASRSKVARRNGCIFDQEIGVIESMEIGEKTCDVRAADVEVPHAEAPSEPNASFEVSVVPDSTSPQDTGVVNPTFESGKLTSNSPHGIHEGMSDSKPKCPGVGKEEEKNDSELDTEQLLKSFKATKRKSFHLGEPNGKKKRHSGKDQADGTEAEENHSDGPDAELTPTQMIGSIPEATKDTQNSPCSDLISPSNSPIRARKCVYKKPDQEVVEAATLEITCSGLDSVAGNSGLSPNKVSKRDGESCPFSVVPQIVDSGLCFTAVEREERNETSKSFQITELDDGISDGHSAPAEGSCAASAAEHNLIAESSLTPDDLVSSAAQTAHETVTNSNGSGEVSGRSSIRSRLSKKRRAQRLESSSECESDTSKEELLTLQEILGTSSHSAVKNQDEGDAAEPERCEGGPPEPLSHFPACPSPDCVDSSQASVDLFGTPEECDVPVTDAGISMESSQFSSEVLVTQQKIEMKKELVRLEKMMALVSEVLQEKEDSPTRGISLETHHSAKTMDADGALLCDQDPGQGSDGKDAGRKPNADPRDDKVVTDGTSICHDGITDMAVELCRNTGLAATSAGAPKTPDTTSVAKTPKKCTSPSSEQEDKENNSPPVDIPKVKLVLVSSGLGPNEQMMVKKFAKRVGGRVVSRVTPEVTHIIMRTDEQLVCERTLKYFLGIAGRKWVLSLQWISECFKQKKLLNESPFEVKGDVVNGSNHQGPSRARTTEDSNLLMRGYKICFHGPFTDMTTDEMEWMVELCGAAVIKDPLLLDSKQKSRQLIIVQPQSESSSSTYRSLSRKATVVTRGWLLDTVATYTLKNLNNYTWSEHEEPSTHAPFQS
ncbi:breast cancer type 1 susceptibility protein-like [Cololabis saira]|uniref:breast cancer type 1 susceptibility protein-like n=1 Tax=Cololabis saira TaxID=129043 RepID=UPI002AD2273A|nr:breast cancer type 1 susceptibility protein-like [Cololabis saira]